MITKNGADKAGLLRLFFQKSSIDPVVSAKGKKSEEVKTVIIITPFACAHRFAPEALDPLYGALSHRIAVEGAKTSGQGEHGLRRRRDKSERMFCGVSEGRSVGLIYCIAGNGFYFFKIDFLLL